MFFSSLQRSRSLSAYLYIAPQPFLLLHYRFTFPPPSSLYHLQPSSVCFSGCRLLPWLDLLLLLLSVFCITAVRSFFLLVVIGLDCREAIEGERL